MNRSSVRGVVLALVVAGPTACGGASSGPATPVSKVEWARQHGTAISAVDTELNLSRSALTAGDRQSVIGACTLLGDDVTEARKGLPVPDRAADSALRRGLDAVALGAADCLQGGRVASNASLNEKAMAELTDARAQMDAADAALASWR